MEAFYRSGFEGRWGAPYSVAEPAVSPDGLRAAFTGEGLDDLVGRPWTRVYVVDLASGGVQQISGPSPSARAPAWSSSGQWLAFLAEVDGHPALQFWEAATGRRLAGAELPYGVDGFAWAHGQDRLVAWGADRRPELGTVARYEGAMWMPAMRSTLEPFVQPVVTQEPGVEPVPWPASPDLWVWEAAWAGSDAVVALVSDRAEPPNWYEARLVRLAGSAVEVLHRPARQAGCLSTGPDGRTAVWIEGLASDRGMIAGAVVTLDLGDLRLRRLDPGTWEITAVRWRDDGRLTYFGVDDLETVGGDIDLPTLDWQETWRTTGTCGMPLPSGCPVGERSALIAHEDWSHPPELHLVGDGPRVPVVAPPETPGVGWLRRRKGAIEAVRWQTGDGLGLSGLLITPEGDPPYPLVVNVHGGPVWAWRNSWDIVFHTPVSLLVSRGFAVLNPNGRGSVGRGPELVGRIAGAMGQADLDDYTSAALALVEQGVADPQRLSVIGHSYGGLVSCALAAATDLFAAAVALSPATDWVSQHYVSAIPGFDELFVAPVGSGAWERSPVSRAGRVATPTLLVGCEDDDCTPVGQAIEFYRAVAERGRAPVALVVYPSQQHGVRGWPALLDQSVRIVEWLERFSR